MNDHIDMVYVENDIKLLRPIKSGAVFDKTRQDNDVADLPHVIHAKNKTELSRLIGSGAVFHEN